MFGSVFLTPAIVASAFRCWNEISCHSSWLSFSLCSKTSRQAGKRAYLRRPSDGAQLTDFKASLTGSSVSLISDDINPVGVYITDSNGLDKSRNRPEKTSPQLSTDMTDITEASFFEINHMVTVNTSTRYVIPHRILPVFALPVAGQSQRRTV
ncbi:hypothetical protein BGZ63DRAFT_197545 [Mariannaea sp. PMI_226]|nr:hypothetical protein BGZ63DRAFT_197545 [Mariannaea sp. PMI_226]